MELDIANTLAIMINMTKKFDKKYKEIYKKYDGKYGDLVGQYTQTIIDIHKYFKKLDKYLLDEPEISEDTREIILNLEDGLFKEIQND